MRATVAVAALVIAVAAAFGIAAVDAQQVVASTGMTPTNASAFSLATVQRDFPGNVAAAMGLAPSRVTLVSAASSGASSYNVTLSFVGTVSNSSMALATEYFTLAMVIREGSSGYNAYLAKYGIETVEVSSIATTTTTAPTPPPATTNASGNHTGNFTTNPESTAPAFTPAPTQVNPDNGNHTYDHVGGDGDDNNGTIYAIIFGIIGVLIVVALVTFCIKHFAKKEKKDTSKRGGGYKYATRNAQHI
uniref:Membrane-associated protein n=1 Tax=Neobodo designis TaxID=312471 RepID=A0A7S1QLF4_NEODS|mmetsp:Transcript_48084/g.148393  ORF Transcript_48084/g.148393 Transcript_48084/m.148393 type:complete len:247 (+) Transcript_48084:141-881(+)